MPLRIADESSRGETRKTVRQSVLMVVAPVRTSIETRSSHERFDSSVLLSQRALRSLRKLAAEGGEPGAQKWTFDDAGDGV